MTYCVAVKLNTGIVYCSDSRTNAGVDQVSTYSKMHCWGKEGHCQYVLLSAGNLATTQGVVSHIHRDIRENNPESLFHYGYLEDAADYIGRLNLLEIAKHVNDDGPTAGFDPSATFIFGGQIQGEEPQLFLIYPQGNHIRTSSVAPFLQIGETKYGKPILDRIIRPDTDVQAAMRCTLVSMDSTMRSNVTVGPPIEMLVYQTDSLTRGTYHSFSATDPYLQKLRQAWDEKVVQAFNEMPHMDAQDRADA